MEKNLSARKGFRAGIHVLVQKGNKYLLIKRADSDLADPSCWDLPGGGIRYLEKPLDAALREVKEEVGLRVRILKIIDIWAKLFEGDWSIESLVEAEFVSGEVSLSKEHSDFKWVSKQEVIDIEPKAENLKALFNLNESLVGGADF
ncbi:NUDIX hydrolase [Candidatus Daviesbacteria bacterium]|nr:NUDIX hydrolase [Candidatus Daviesbacteria bacterium]